MSLGPCLRRPRQRAASHSSAVESDPPETARIRTGVSERSANSAAASESETGASEAADTLLFPLRRLLHVRGRLRILAGNLSQRRARRLLLVERCERLAEPQQRVRRLAGALELARHGEERLGSLAIALALEQAFAEPIVRVSDQTIAGMLLEERAQAFLGERIVLAQHIAVREIVFVARGV